MNILKKNKEITIYLTLVALSFILFGVISGNYHWVDDHEIIRFKQDIINLGFWNSIQVKLAEDLMIRWRPFYYLHRFINVYLFSDNLIIWQLSNLFLFLSSSVLFYLGLVNFFKSKRSAILGVVVSFIGVQAATWWRLGPNEAIASLFFTLAFFVFSTGKKDNFISLMFCLSLCFMGLSKESFLLFIPAFIAVDYYVVRRKYFFYIIPAITFGLSLYLILFVIGTNKIGYAGVDNDFFDKIESFFKLTFYQLRRFWILTIAPVVYLFLKDKANLRFNLPILLLSLFIIFSNTFLYTKSGMYERYYLPTLYGFGILIAGFWAQFFKVKNKLAKVGFYLLFVLLVYKPSQRFYSEMKKYVSAGNNVQQLIDRVKLIDQGNHSKVLIYDIKSTEWSHSTYTYLSNKLLQTKVYLSQGIGQKNDLVISPKSFLSVVGNRFIICPNLNCLKDLKLEADLSIELKNNEYALIQIQ